MREAKSFEMASNSNEMLDEIVIAPDSIEIHRFLHPSMSSPINFCDNNIHFDDFMPSTSHHPIAHPPTNESPANVLVSAAAAPAPAHFSNQLTTDSCSPSKNSKSRRAEYSRGMQTCSTSTSGGGGGGSCNPSQDSAFGSMTEGDLSVASSSIRMSSFQSMSSPIDESVEDSLIGIPGPSLSRGSTTSNNESMDQSDYCSLQTAATSVDFNLSKKKSASFGTTNALPIEPPTILVNDKNSIYTSGAASPAKTLQVFSQKYRVSSFEDMSVKRNFLRNSQQNYRSLEEERRIDSAFIPVANHGMPYHQQSLDTNCRALINNAEKFKKLTHVSFASKISSTRERHIVWKNSILARKNNLIKSNESLHDYAHSTAIAANSDKITHAEYFADMKLCKRVCSSNELSSSAGRADGETRCGTTTITENLKYSARKSCSERFLWNTTMLRQSTIVSDYEECDEDECHEMVAHSDDACSNSSSSGCFHSNIMAGASTTSATRTENNSTDSSPSHRSMCKIIGGIDADTRHIDEKVPLLDSMEMSPISPVETDELL